MTLQVGINTAGILIAAATAFLISYWQRKQMRQIELFRRDPNAGLVPPPSRLWTFIRSRRNLVFAFVAALWLIPDVLTREPITRGAVFVIAAKVALIVYSLITDLLDMVIRIMQKQLELQEQHLKSTTAKRPLESK